MTAMASEYERFYLGTQGTRVGNHMIEEILDWPDATLESVHAYVQVAFPTPAPSKVQPGAVSETLTAEIIARMVTNPTIMERYDRMLTRMLAFWGMCRHSDAVLEIVDKQRFQSKLGQPDHNQLRMTRVLASLQCLGKFELAQALQETLAHNIDGQATSKGHWLRIL